MPNEAKITALPKRNMSSQEARESRVKKVFKKCCLFLKFFCWHKIFTNSKRCLEMGLGPKIALFSQGYREVFFVKRTLKELKNTPVCQVCM